MVTMKNKPGKSVAWLPNQIDYGMDVSDPDPSNWKPFGRLADAAAEEKAKQGSKGPTVPSQPAR